MYCVCYDQHRYTKRSRSRRSQSARDADRSHQSTSQRALVVLVSTTPMQNTVCCTRHISYLPNCNICKPTPASVFCDLREAVHTITGVWLLGTIIRNPLNLTQPSPLPLFGTLGFARLDAAAPTPDPSPAANSSGRRKNSSATTLPPTRLLPKGDPVSCYTAQHLPWQGILSGVAHPCRALELLASSPAFFSEKSRAVCRPRTASAYRRVPSRNNSMTAAATAATSRAGTSRQFCRSIAKCSTPEAMLSETGLGRPWGFEKSGKKRWAVTPGRDEIQSTGGAGHTVAGRGDGG
jgi:hypothetical protein